MPDSNAILDSLIRRVSSDHCSLATAQTLCDETLEEDRSSSPKRLLQALIAYAEDHKSRHQYGRLCGAIIVGAFWFSDMFIAETNRRRLLIATQPIRRFEGALENFLERLQAADNARLAVLTERAETYLTLYRLQQLAGPGATELVALRERPFLYGKALMAVADWAFRRHSIAYEANEDLDRAIEGFNTPEEVAAAVSAVLATVNKVASLDVADFTFPLEGPEFSSTCIQLLRYGHRLSILSETEKLITVLGYRLTLARSLTQKVFIVTPVSAEVEYAVRLGFVRGELGMGSSRIYLAQSGKDASFSIFAAVKTLVDRSAERLIDIKDAGEPYRRLRTRVPLMRSLYDSLANLEFYEDAVMEERLAQEFEVPMRLASAGEKWELIDSLDVTTFVRAWRALRFTNLVDIVALQRHQADERLVMNSLVRVVRVEEFKELLSMFGLSDPQVSAFLSLISADVNRLGYFDIQYKPFLSVNQSTFEIDGERKTSPPEIVFTPAVAFLSNVMPNVQRAHGIRISTNADAFVALTAEQLKTVFSRVRTNCAVKFGELKTDIDIVALGDDTVYLFECKHSITPTGAHELRDLWNDINRGVRQLEIAEKILADKLGAYLAGWFPGIKHRKAQELNVRRCVVCSHRVFSGLRIRGVPIRDHASLSLLLDDAVVQMGYSEDGREMSVERWRLRKEETPAVADIENYLSDDSVFFATFRPFMRSYTRRTQLSKSVFLAEDSYTYQLRHSEWRKHLENLGAVRLEDKLITLGPALPPGDQGNTDGS